MMCACMSNLFFGSRSHLRLCTNIWWVDTIECDCQTGSGRPSVGQDGSWQIAWSWPWFKPHLADEAEQKQVENQEGIPVWWGEGGGKVRRKERPVLEGTEWSSLRHACGTPPGAPSPSHQDT